MSEESIYRACLVDILDEYLPRDWRTANLQRWMLTESTCLLAAAQLIQNEDGSRQ